MNNAEYFEIISGNKLFKNADRGNIAELIEKGSFVCDYSSGTQIDMTEKLAFVLSGEIYAYSRDSKRNLLLRKIEKYEIFGVAGLFSNDKILSRCFSKGNSEILFFEKAAVCKLLEKDKNVMYNYIKFLSERIGYLNKKITYLTAGSAERKLAVFLSGFDKENVELEISYSSLSDMLDIGRASLYRAFDRFVSDGCIKRSGNNITIINKALMLEKY